MPEPLEYVKQETYWKRPSKRLGIFTVAVAKTKQVRKGRYRATAIVKIPKRYEGRFQYVSCFTYSKGSGMGDPDTLTCPKRRARVG